MHARGGDGDVVVVPQRLTDQVYQDRILALQTHASYSLPRRAWLAIDATWFTGGETRVDGLPSPDLQRNTRVGATFSIPLTSQQSMKFAYSTGAITRRGSDFDSLTATWQLVMFLARALRLKPTGANVVTP